MLPKGVPAPPPALARGLSRLLLLFAVLAAVASPLAAQPEDGAESQTLDDSALVATAPVTVDGTRLFDVRGISSYPAEIRAEIIAGRIREFAGDPAIQPEMLQITEGERETRIVAGNRAVVTVFDADGSLEGVPRQLLAQMFLAKIQEAINAYRASRTRDAVLDATWRAAVATVVALVALFVLRRALRRLRASLERRYQDRLQATSARSFEVMREGRLWGLVDAGLRFVTWTSILFLVFLYLRYALGLFPWTRGIALQLGAWVLAPITRLTNAFVDVLPNLFFLGILYVLTRWAIRLIRLFFTAAGRSEVELKGFHPEWAEPTYKLVRLLVIVLAVVIAYPYIPGSNSLAFKSISVFAGILFSLGSSSAISNVIAGYILIYRRVFVVGDVVTIGDVFGRVTDVRLQVTHVRTIKNEEIIVPNSTIVSSNVVNHSTLSVSDGLILHTTVGIGYDTPWQQVEAMLLEAAARTPGIKTEPKPFVLQLALGEFAVTHQVNVYCDTARTMTVTRAALHRNILDVFNEYGVQIMTPAYEGDTEQPKVVPPEQWYAAPARKTEAAATPSGAAAESGPAGARGAAIHSAAGDAQSASEGAASAQGVASR
jgi:small-conductance mechanosensitive channel